MSSWDTNPWSNFCDLHWELICRSKWHPGTSEISTPSEIAVGTHFHSRHATKTTPVFLPADGEASWSLLPISVSLLSGGTVQPESTYSCILKVTGKVKIFQSLVFLHIEKTFSGQYYHLIPPENFKKPLVLWYLPQYFFLKYWHTSFSKVL